MSAHLFHILHLLHMLHIGYGTFTVDGVRAACHVYLSHGQIYADDCRN